MPETRVFLDTSALFAAVLSSGGGARALLKLGESGAIRIWVGPTVLQEADEVFRRKAPICSPCWQLCSIRRGRRWACGHR